MPAVCTMAASDDLAPGPARIAHRSADDKASGRIDVIFRVAVEHSGWHDGTNYQFHNRFAQIRVGNLLVVLRRDYHGVYAHRASISVFDADLVFFVSAK